MAISKERLKELIKEGATIWALGRYAFQDKIEEIKLDEDFFSVSNSALIYPDLFATKLEDLFETKEQAEWALKYHATRTEELDLPMWEDWQRVNKIGMYAVSFRDKKHHYCELMCFYDEIKVTRQAYGLEVLFDEPNTEENYEKACDLCLKLFEGEEE